jgi:hypothetical protein
VNRHLETYLESVRSRLALSQSEAAEVVAELRAHLCADYGDRVAAGQDEAAAARQAAEEMGPPDSVAHQLNRVRRPEGSLLRTIAAVEIALFGFFGVLIGADGPFRRALHGVLDVIAIVIGGRFQIWYWTTWSWVTEHPPVGTVLVMLPLAGVALLAGFVAKRRGWAFGLAPLGMVAGLNWVSMALHRRIPFDPVEHFVVPVGAGLVLAVGGQLGVRLTASPRRLRIAAVATATALVTPVCAVGFAADIGNIHWMGVYAVLFAAVTWVSVNIAARLRRRSRRRAPV